MALNKADNIKTTTYKEFDWRIDIVEFEDEFEAWLYHKDFGIKELMFGSAKEQHELDGTPYTVDYDYFCELVEANMIDYMRDYLAEYCNIEIVHES